MDDIKETTVTEEKKEIVEQYKKLLFIVNPKAGQKKREDILVDVINIFNDYGYEVLIKFTRREKHATEIVKALGSQVDMIACMGGDGTLNEVMAGMRSARLKKPLGYIPAGSTNDFANSLNLPSDPVEAAKHIMTHKAKYIDNDEMWETAESQLRAILKEMNIDFYEAEGEAAFYGPKIDIQAKNVYGKEDTMITIQLDCAIAENFDMYYIDQNGDKQRPYVIHRTSMGCYERTLAWLIEKYAGKFPTWLCPEQVRVLPISEKFADYAEEVNKELKKNGILSTVDNRSEKIGYKIREARLQKLPYMLVVGAQEQEAGKVSVRSRFAGDEGQKDLKDFISAICEEIRTKEIRQEVEQ